MDKGLNYARAEAGKAEITISKVDLPNLVETVASSLEPMVLKYRNELLVRLEGEPVAELDEGKLRVIMNNLLTNACKYTADGHIRLKVECGVDNLNIVVADTGIGIPESQHTLIFEPFNQVDRSDAREDAGVGLGLAITKRFCEMLGGHIQVDSRVGTGSKFSVTIPLPVGRESPMARS